MKQNVICPPVKAMMLLLLFGLAAGNALAQEKNPTKGLSDGSRGEVDTPFLEKRFEATKPDGSEGVLTLETYVTGELNVTETRIPSDITLVLDMSGSMDELIYESCPSRSYSYNNFPTDQTYYYKDSYGNYHEVKRDSHKPLLGSRFYYLFYTDYFLIIPVNNYLVGGGVEVSRPTNFTSPDATIWTGVLYTRSETKIAALKTAVKGFIDIIEEDAVTHPDEHGNPIDHKISIVKFASEYYDNNESSLAEGNHTYYSGGIFGTNYNYTEVVKNLTAVSNGGALALRTSIDNLSAGGATYSNYGMTKAKYVMVQSESTPEAPRQKVVVMFTDGVPGASGFNNATANSCIAAAKVLKDSETTVYTVGVFGDLSEEDQTKIDTYMNRTSSKYPDATSFTQEYPGEPADGDYYFTAGDADELANIFANIAHQSGGEVLPLDANTIVQDIVSDSFTLPEGTTIGVDETDVRVYLVDCIGAADHIPSGYTADDLDAKGRLFAQYANPLPASWHSITVGGTPDLSDMVTIEGKQIQVTGFDFAANWCGWNDAIEPSGAIQGQKLVIKIPIKAEEGVWGDNISTNGEMSFVQPSNTSVVYYFPKPSASVKRMTWVEQVKTAPDGWNPSDIDSEEDLAWLISVVCGYNGQAPDPYTDATITADLDMGEYNWVPIGGCEGYYSYNSDGTVSFNPSSLSNEGFQGVFDGGGHSITGLRNQPSVVFQPGMFGKVNGGTVKNTFVMDCGFNAGSEGYFGIIADTLCSGGIIYNCEAAGQLKSCEQTVQFLNPANTSQNRTVDPENIYLGGIVGLVDGCKVHSCISVAELYGYSLGGLANETRESNAAMENSYGYPAFYSWQPAVGVNIGGMLAVNGGKLANCYIRERNQNDDYIGGIKYTLDRIDAFGGKADMHKGLLVGVNSGSVSNCYVPDTWWNEGEAISQGFVGNGTAAASIGKFSITETPYMYKHNDNQVTMLNAKDGETQDLLVKLNDWVNTNGSNYTTWFRTTADGINNDYPVLKIMDFNTVGSDDHVRLYYGDINHMMGSTSMYSENTSDDTYCIYQNAAVTTGNNDATLYINEDVAVTQTEDLAAYVGITLDNSAHDANGGASQNTPNGHDYGANTRDWHMFATSLSDAPLGVNYTDDTEWPFFYDGDPDAPAMTKYAFFDEDTHDGYFPSHTYGKTPEESGYNYYTDWDFYCYSEPDNHWINFKRNSASHWAENIQGLNLDYTNEETLTPGKGYLMAVANETFLQSHGTLNRGNVTIDLTNSRKNEMSRGFNLVGNPYQSYLDFDAFAEENGIDSYTILDEDKAGYLTYAAEGSRNTESASRYINMHQGFLVYTDANATVQFTEDMRNFEIAEGAETPTFRGDEKASYTLVNLIVTESDGKREIVTVETGRPELGGARKMMGLLNGKSQLYAHCGGESYSVLFATEEMHTVPVRFRTYSDDTFTLSWDVENGSLDELYLVDNITGQTVDMLTQGEYRFEGRTTDFSSRFKLVFGNGGDDEPAEGEDIEDIFAYQNDGNLMVTCGGRLEMYDMSGRLVECVSLYGDLNTVALPKVTRGVYTLRLTNSTDSKVQKIVIR